MSNYAQADQSFPTVQGATYELTFDILAGVTSGFAWVGSGQGGNDLLNASCSAVQSYSFQFTAPGTITWVRFGHTELFGSMKLDNVSCKALTAGDFEGLGLNQLLGGMADNWEIVWAFMRSLTHIRDPRLTPVLADLEREYGIYPNPALLEADRRAKLAAIKYARVGTASKDDLENALHRAGFALELIRNGRFDRDLQNWITTGSASWLSPGNLKLSDQNSYVDQPLNTVPGSVYTVRWRVIDGVNSSLKVGTTQGASDLLIYSWTVTGYKITQFTATSTLSWLRIEGTISNIVVIDDVSVTTYPTLYVWENSPAQNPAVFLCVVGVQCGEPLAQCGEPTAQAQCFKGELIVNGDIFDFTVDYTVLCGTPLAQCGEPTALAGEFTGVTRTKIEYRVPTDPDDWPLVFFVGGPATFNPATGPTTFCGEPLAQCGEPLAQCANFRGELADIEFVDLPLSRRADLVRLILQIKPVHAWCLLLVNFT